MIGQQRSRQPSLAAFQVRKHKPDYGLLVIASILLAVGLIVMYAISPALASMGGNVSENYFVTKQLIAIILGFVFFFAAAKIPLSTWERLQKPLIVTAFILCAATIVLNGLASRWIHLGSISFQPVELVKFILVISGAVVFSKAARAGDVSRMQILKPLLISLAAFSAVIVFLQRDLGSAFVLLFIIGVMAFMAGLPMKKLLIFLIAVSLVSVMAVSTTSYRRDRLMTFLQPTRDCTDTGYHACQALIAVGSGGLIGVGLGRSVQAYGYLPEAENDSIFAIFAEKFGFIGVIALIGLIGALLLRIINIMQRAPNKASQLVCAGVLAWFGFQALVNIGAMIGLLPLKGITLPFVSYGGTSLVFVMAALGIVFQISSYSSIRKSSFDFDQEGSPNESSYNWRRNSRPHYTTTRSSF